MQHRGMLLISFGVFCIQNWFFVSSQDIALHICDDLIKPDIQDGQENCTLLCGLYIRHYVLPANTHETALCVKDPFTPLLCHKNGDCQQHHPQSKCKKVQCLCEEDDNDHRFLPRRPVDFLEMCVVSSNLLQPNMPLVQFPWKTVLTVFGCLGLIVIIFMGFRWLYPLMRTFHGRDGRYRQNNEHNASFDGNTVSPLYTEIPQATLGNRSITQGHPDKPPSYETLVQLLDLPPSYEEMETTTPSRPFLPNEENENQRRERSPTQQPIENGNETTTHLQNNK